MRIPFLRYGLAVMTTVALSGCYSGGRWTTPNLAFWKSNPFSSTSKSTAPEAVPRPSQLATQPGPPPGTGYSPGTSDTADTLAPAYPTTASGFEAHPPYSPAGVQPAAGTAGMPYMAPQQGHYAPGPPGGIAAANPYGAPTGGHNGPGAPPAPTHNPYAVGNTHGAAPSYVATNPSGPYANPVRGDAQGSYDARLADYRSTAGMHASSIPDYRSENDQPRAETPPDYRSWPGERAAHGPGAPYDQATSPAASAHGHNTAQGYYPPSNNYSPGNTGYQPQGLPPYQPPYNPNVPADGATSDPGYSPGSVGRYNP